MLEAQEDVFYYLTVANENYPHPAMPKDAREGILRGMYRIREGAQVQLLGLVRARSARGGRAPAKDWNIAAGVWSVTSFTELRRDGMAAERTRRLGGQAKSWVETCLDGTDGPVIAASDYVRAVPDLIRGLVKSPYTVLGTDGFRPERYARGVARLFRSRCAPHRDRRAVGDRREPSSGALRRYELDPGAAPLGAVAAFRAVF